MTTRDSVEAARARSMSEQFFSKYAPTYSNPLSFDRWARLHQSPAHQLTETRTDTTQGHSCSCGGGYKVTISRSKL